MNLPLGPSDDDDDTGLTHPKDILLSFQVHSKDVHFKLDVAHKAFQVIQDLGGNSVRTDLSWFDIEPVMDHWDQPKIDWYRNYYREAAQTFKLTPMAILYGIPTWATDLYRRDANAFLDRWMTYCDMAATILAGKVHLIQIWNEPNNPVYAIVDRCQFPSLFRIARERLTHLISPIETAVNVAAGFPNWEDFVSSLLEEADGALDIIGIDHYPATWTLSNAIDWRTLKQMMRRVNDPQDKWYGKKPAILETGYSTYVPFFRDESKQRDWINAAFPEIRKINDEWMHYNGVTLRMVTWYKLFNDYGEAFLNPEAHFGILHILDSDMDFNRKIGYNSLKDQLRAFGTQSGMTEEGRE